MTKWPAAEDCTNVVDLNVRAEGIVGAGGGKSAMMRWIWIRIACRWKGPQQAGAQGTQTMHDMIGSAGMLRGWMQVWSAHMLLLLATLIVSVGAGALVELLTTHLRTARSAVAVDSIHSDE